MLKNGKRKNSENNNDHKVAGRVGNSWKVTIDQAKDRAQRAFDQLRHRNTAIIDNTPHKFLLTINGYTDYGWPNVMTLYRYIREKLGDKIDLMKLFEDQDLEGKQTLKLILEFRGNPDKIKTQIEKRARTISAKPEKGQLPGGPNPKVTFKELDE